MTITTRRKCFKNLEKNTQRLFPKVISRKAACSPQVINFILNKSVCFTFNKQSPGWKDFFSGSSSGDGLVAKSCPTLVSAWTVARQAPLSMGFPSSRPKAKGIF